jgi:hypothetical protein
LIVFGRGGAQEYVLIRLYMKAHESVIKGRGGEGCLKIDFFAYVLNGYDLIKKSSDLVKSIMILTKNFDDYSSRKGVKLFIQLR